MSSRIFTLNTLILLLFLILQTSLKKSASKELPLRPANVLFLIDQSNSIWHFNFLREIRFVKETISRFAVGRNHTRVAVGTYGDSLHVRIQPKHYRDIKGLSQLIDRIRRPHTPRTRLARGLKAFHLVFAGDASWCDKRLPGPLIIRKKPTRKTRSVAPPEETIVTSRERPLNVVVVLGDGDYTDVNETSTMVSCLKREGVSIFSVGVGRHVNVPNLQKIAAYPSSLFSINITHLDPKVMLQDSIANSKPNKIWEFMIKHRAMSEDCLPHRSRIHLNFVFDIMSQKSWRYPILLAMAEDMYVRLYKKYQHINPHPHEPFVKLNFYPNSYGPNYTIHPSDSTTWEEDDEKRFRALLKFTAKMKTLKKDNYTEIESVKKRRNAWDRLSKTILKILIRDGRKVPSTQNVVVYVTDRVIEMTMPQETLLRTNRLVEINKKMATLRRFELFGLTLGGFYKLPQVEAVLRKYHSNPHSRLYAFRSLHRGYNKSMKGMVDLFCKPPPHLPDAPLF